MINVFAYSIMTYDVLVFFLLPSRKETMAATHWRHTLLRKCVTAWQLFVELQQTERHVVKEQEVTKTKMAAFLEAAASGRFVT